jgi:hypothetical protein
MAEREQVHNVHLGDGGMSKHRTAAERNDAGWKYVVEHWPEGDAAGGGASAGGGDGMNVEKLKRETPDALGRWYGAFDARHGYAPDAFGRAVACIEAGVLVATYSAREHFCYGYRSVLPAEKVTA